MKLLAQLLMNPITGPLGKAPIWRGRYMLVPHLDHRPAHVSALMNMLSAAMSGTDGSPSDVPQVSGTGADAVAAEIEKPLQMLNTVLSMCRVFLDQNSSNLQWRYCSAFLPQKRHELPEPQDSASAVASQPLHIALICSNCLQKASCPLH